MAMFTPNRRPPRFESPGEPRVSVTPCKRKWGFSPEEKQHPHGPVRIQEFMSWPTDVIASIAAWDSDALGNLVGVLRRGLAVNSDYSGMDCPREVLTQCFEAVARFKCIDKNEFRLTFSRASDKGQLQKNILTRIATANDGSCVMGDILERLPKSARKYIAAAAPAKNDPREKKIKANQHILEWLQQNRGYCFLADARSPCCVHGAQCMVFQDRTSPTEGRRHPIRMSVAGVTCVGWSAEGQREEFAHESEIPHAVWMTERFQAECKNLEDCFFAECTVRYPVERLAEHLPNHTIISIIDGPEKHGWPSKRPRVLIFGWSNARLRWAGPHTSREEITKDYSRKFHRTTVRAGDVFMAASADDVMKEYIELAKVQTYQLTEQDFNVIGSMELLSMVLPPGAVQRFHAWQKHLSEKDPDPDAEYIVDVEHHCRSRGASSGSQWPVQLTHVLIMKIPASGDGWRLATPMEHLAAHGWHVFDHTLPGDYSVTKQKEILEGLSSHSLKTLNGNSMHLRTQGAWMMYCLSYLHVKPNVFDVNDEWDELYEETESQVTCSETTRSPSILRVPEKAWRSSLAPRAEDAKDVVVVADPE